MRRRDISRRVGLAGRGCEEVLVRTGGLKGKLVLTKSWAKSKAFTRSSRGTAVVRGVNACPSAGDTTGFATIQFLLTDKKRV